VIDPFTIVAPTASADGYGCSAEALILAATRHHGAQIALIGHDWADERYTDPELLALKVPPGEASDGQDLLVVYFLPYALTQFRGTGTTVLMSMWETDRLPDTWAQLCTHERTAPGGILVPSEHCREVFAAAVECPVEVAPFGTDTGLYTVRKAERPPDAPFTFLMSGLLHYRKGVQFALRALREEFRPGENVRLVLKTRRQFLDPGPESAMLSDPRVTVINDDYTREELRALYHGADCLLAPSRGEGSGLTPRDAMATGLPVILTDWGGLRELADPRYSYPVQVECLEPAPEENSSYGRGVTGGGPIGNFARPSVASLRASMREVYEDRDGARRRGLAAAAWTRERWTWKRCAGEWLRALERLSMVPA
jgi:glycosyltransferase involved in cell wall biosynthesis